MTSRPDSAAVGRDAAAGGRVRHEPAGVGRYIPRRPSVGGARIAREHRAARRASAVRGRRRGRLRPRPLGVRLRPETPTTTPRAPSSSGTGSAAPTSTTGSAASTRCSRSSCRCPAGRVRAGRADVGGRPPGVRRRGLLGAMMRHHLEAVAGRRRARLDPLRRRGADLRPLRVRHGHARTCSSPCRAVTRCGRAGRRATSPSSLRDRPTSPGTQDLVADVYERARPQRPGWAVAGPTPLSPTPSSDWPPARCASPSRCGS